MKSFLFQYHISLNIKSTIYFQSLFICTFNNRIKRIQYDDGYYEGETTNNIKNG